MGLKRLCTVESPFAALDCVDCVPGNKMSPSSGGGPPGVVHRRLRPEDGARQEASGRDPGGDQC